MKKFSNLEFIKENENWYDGLPTIQIKESDFNTFSDEDLNRYVLCFNDGQGDHSVYTFKKIVGLLENSDRPDKKKVSEMTRIEILDTFYDELDITGNSSDELYFDGEYKNIMWM